MKIKKNIHCSKAPEAIGPYSQGVLVESGAALLFISGQIPIDPKCGEIVEGGIAAQTRQAISNLEAILIEAGSTLSHVVRVDIFLEDMKNDFQAMNAEYAAKFNGPIPPARQTVQVSALPLGARIEISCIAVKEVKDV